MAKQDWRAFVDRIEGDCAVLLVGDDGEQVLWPTKYLPAGVGEGSVISFTVGADITATKGAENVINSLIDGLEHEE